MAKISILIILLPHLYTILCNETNNNDGSNQFLKIRQLNNDNNECGISFRDTTILLSRTIRTSPGQWPWLVGIFKNYANKNLFEFQCAGTLLSNRHILTAAHCVKLNHYSNDTVHPFQLMIALGRFNLHQWREREAINREVEKIEIHPDYAHTSSADSDLAILTLKTPVEFNNFVKPICLWSGSTDLQDVVNRTGYVVGWGMSSPYTSSPEQPRAARVPIVSQETCLRSNVNFLPLTSERTFCAGLQNDTPCIEDSGSGLVLLDNITNRYQLRGVVSRSVFSSDSLSCDHRNYIVYVDAAKYVPWIQQHISTA